jgi:alpha-mannosidase
VDVGDGTRGLAYFTRGTQRHRVRGRTLANVLAWGDDTDRIGNRTTARPWRKSFDQRLRGSHLIEYALYPHAGRWDEADVVQAARRYRTPFLAVETGLHDGRLPASGGLLDVGPANVLVTAVEPRGDGVRLRLCESAGRDATLEVHSGDLGSAELAALDGRPLARLRPYQIAHLSLRRS